MTYKKGNENISSAAKTDKTDEENTLYKKPVVNDIPNQ